MPYKLTYGAEAMIPVEIHELRRRCTNFKEGQNDEDRRINLDLLLEE